MYNCILQRETIYGVRFNRAYWTFIDEYFGKLVKNKFKQQYRSDHTINNTLPAPKM